MIIFSQGIASHSRIGNSLAWMSRASSYCKKNGIEYYFPYAWSFFSNYLKKDSPWLNVEIKTKSENLMKSLGFESSSADSVASLIRPLQVEFEQRNGLNAFQWPFMAHEFCDGQALVVCGDLRMLENEILGYCNNYKCVVIHEPFPFDISSVGEDYESVAPSGDLISKVKSRLMKNQYLNVGYHIRRGDYAQWQGGRYYFSDDYWIRLINSRACDEVNLYIYSNDLNESIRNILLGMNCNIVEGTYYEDFVMMMQMDELYGPPSTFTGMAATLSRELFFKNIYLSHLESKIEV